MAPSTEPHVVELGEIRTRSKAAETDEAALSRLGKKTVLKRRFGFLSTLGFSCTVLITWEASLILFLVGLQNGGPAGVVYGYLVVWAGTISTFMVLCELVSMAPTSGGQYHWVAMLAPRSQRKVLSYVSGWLTVCGWQASVGSGAYLTGTMVQGLIILTRPDYIPENWHGTLLYWAVMLFCVIINVAAGWLLPKYEGAMIVLHILGFFGIMIPLLTLGPKGSPGDVFTTFMNLGEWKSQGLSFCIGIMGTVFAFVGGDGPIHMCEEIQNAAIVVPRSILTGVMINGSLGFAMVLTILFRAGDIDQAIVENPAYPYMAIFKHAVNSTSGAAAMASLIMVLAMSSNVGLLASSSRVFWAFSRDKGLPGWRTLSKISPRTSIPVYSVTATTVIACILALVNIGSSTAFNGIISIAIAGLFSSYLLVTALLLYRRCTGGVVPANASVEGSSIADGATYTPIIWGPWRLPGVVGIANNVFACAYLAFVLFFSFWPSYAAVTPKTMNWSILVTGFVAVFSTLYYVVWARKTYNGPIVEVEPHYVDDVSSKY
ncbi:amino acid/polyamine transporter I [Massariosphaeria phaeospora]|uniref:Amino acid/polyamine transporter I n=1 Tax=Massariosphaeria phaeospora TaxID=100035 RepID=A0A7C8I7I0_9PLEO|nr:amino acid/polyamine transporter I [Massariosphaeria phaeospora]